MFTHGLLNLQDGTLIWRRMNSYAWALEAQVYVTSQLNVIIFLHKMVLSTIEKMLVRTKRLILISETWTPHTLFYALCHHPTCFWNGFDIVDVRESKTLIKESALKQLVRAFRNACFYFCPCCRVLLLECTKSYITSKLKKICNTAIIILLSFS